jgi:kynurenine formamidase
MKYHLHLASIVLTATVIVACSRSYDYPSIDLNTARWVDLSHSFDKNTLYWPNNKKGFEHQADFNGITSGNFFYSSYSFSTPEHGGTHIDAPIHFAEKGWTLDQIPLSSLTGYAVVIDAQKQASINPDYLINVQDVLDWEKINGKIKPHSIVLFNTGYGNAYPIRGRYFGTEKIGEEAIPDLHFPGISPELSTWLVQERQPKAVGIDTASIDYGQSKDFKTHQILLGNNIPGFENLANLDRLPVQGAYIVALPMKISGGSGGPLRIVAAIQ